MNSKDEQDPDSRRVSGTSKIESFTVGKGKTTKPHADEEEWNKRYLEITVRLANENQLQEALTKAEHIIDDFLRQVDVSSVPDIDIAEINGLPWRTFVKGSEPGSAVPNRPGWVFSKEKGAEKLFAALQKSGSLDLGEWTFKLGGTDNSLIQRTRRKPK